MVSHLSTSLDRSWHGLLLAERVLSQLTSSPTCRRQVQRAPRQKRKSPQPGLTYFGGILNNLNDPSKRGNSEVNKSTSRSKAYGEESDSGQSRSWLRDTPTQKEMPKFFAFRVDQTMLAPKVSSRKLRLKKTKRTRPIDREKIQRPNTASLESTSTTAFRALQVQRCPLTSHYRSGQTLWRSSRSAMHIGKARARDAIFCNEEIRRSTEERPTSRSIKAVISIPVASPTRDCS